MRTRTTIVLGLSVIAGLGVRLAVSQEAEVEPPQQDAAPTVEPSMTPPPGEEVMRPTTHGFRLTRRMAEGLGKVLVREEMDPEGTLSKGQREQLAARLSDRIWDLKVRHARDGSRAAEHMYETLIGMEGPNGRQLTTDEAREFSEKVGPGVGIVREFWEGVLDDARPVLDPERYAKLEEKADDMLKMTRRFEEKMDRWSRGEVKENESPFDGIDENDIDGTGKRPEYVRAERSARWRVNSVGPDDWRRFLNQAVRVFEFDDEQKRAAERLLSDYTEQAKAIMTPEWKAKATHNRVQEQLRWQAGDQPVEPWIYKIEADYNAMTRPLQEMGRTFRSAVFAMVRPDQRERLLADLQKVGERHGMSLDETDISSFFPPYAQVASEGPANGGNSAPADPSPGSPSPQGSNGQDQ